MRKIHRTLAVFAILLGLYIASTGLTLQLMDLHALLTGAPASNPTMQSIRTGIDGPPNFQVIRDPDYSASALPQDFDFDQALATIVTSARKLVGSAAIAFVEFRMLDGKPVGMVASQGQLHRFDAATGGPEGSPTKLIQQPLSRPSIRNNIKDYHRMKAFGSWGLFLDLASGLIMFAMVITGLSVYFQLLMGRSRVKRRAPFWFSGGWWRTLHRSVAVVSGVFIAGMAITGSILSINSIGVVFAVAKDPSRPAINRDLSSPLQDAELPAILLTALNAFNSTEPGTPIKVLRLRYYAGMPQGVVIAGGAETHQVVLDARTGRVASETEPEYPFPGNTFGWQVDEMVKQIHRGDYFGLTGRWVSLISGFAFLYLIISGMVMYVSMIAKRLRSAQIRQQQTTTSNN